MMISSDLLILMILIAFILGILFLAIIWIVTHKLRKGE